MTEMISTRSGERRAHLSGYTGVAVCGFPDERPAHVIGKPLGEGLRLTLGPVHDEVSVNALP